MRELHEGCEKRGGVCDCGVRPCAIDASILWATDTTNRTLFTITADGDVVLGKDVTLTEAAQAFWNEVDRLRPGKVKGR